MCMRIRSNRDNAALYDVDSVVGNWIFVKAEEKLTSCSYLTAPDQYVVVCLRYTRPHTTTYTDRAHALSWLSAWRKLLLCCNENSVSYRRRYLRRTTVQACVIYVTSGWHAQNGVFLSCNENWISLCIYHGEIFTMKNVTRANTRKEKKEGRDEDFHLILSILNFLDIRRFVWWFLCFYIHK